MQFRRAAKLCFALVAALALPSGLFAQGQTGTIAGTVKDATGAVLPGVTVEAASPALIEKTRTVVTDGQGEYKIIDLRAGTYTVTFSLAGFSSVKREGIELTTSFTANVGAEMRVGGVAETITVSGESPIVDVQNVQQKSTATRDAMDQLPTDRNFVSFAALTPAVLVTGVRQNVGGSIPETGMNLVIHGSRAGDSLVMVDGMPIINGSGSGGLQYGNYLNNAVAQEITFQTDSQSAEFERASVYSNFIPKDGSNVFHGSFTGRYTGQKLESSNLDASDQARGLTSGSRVDKIWDVDPAAGGPLIKDRLWLFSSFRNWGTYNTVAGSYLDQSFTELFYQPSTTVNDFPVWHDSAVARLTTQVSEKNKVNLYYDWQYTYFGNCFVPSYQTALSACPVYKNIPQYIVQGSWSSPVTNKLLLEAGGMITAQDFQGFRQPGVSLTQFSITDPFAAPGFPTTWGSNTAYGHNRSNQENYRASATYVTGSHAFKAGMTLMHQWHYNTQDVNNSVSLTLHGGVPFSLTQYATPIQYRETVNYNAGIFAQDQWTIKRMTLNYGVRFDLFNGGDDAQSIGAGPFTPAHAFGAVTNVPNWKDIDPRVGVAYDLFGNGKTAIKASVGRYVIADAYTIAHALNPELIFGNTTTRSWSDPSGTFNPFNDCNLTNPAANGGCGQIATPNFGQLGTRVTNYDPSIVTGWGVRPYNWETQASIQQQLFPRVSVYAGYTKRIYGNLTAIDNQAVSNASYTGYCIPVPGNSLLPGGGGGQECGLFDINKPTTANNLVVNANQFGGIIDHYDGLDFVANARLGRGLVLSGGVSVGRERTNNCDLIGNLSLSFLAPSGLNAPRLTPFCDVTPPFQPLVKGQVVYPLPWGIQASGTFQSLPGPQLSGQYALSNAIAAPSLGRNFSSVAPSVDLIPPGTLYGDRIYQTDLRFSKSIKAGRTIIRPTVSLYNTFNANPIQTYNTTFNPINTSSFLGPTVILTPRFLDFGLQVEF
jgi:Carboxypeptidase regulatory-like domain